MNATLVWYGLRLSMNFKSHFQKMLKFYIWKAMFMLSTTKNKIILNWIIFELLKLKYPPNRSSTRPLIWLFIKSIPTQVCNHASIDIVELHKETPTKTDKQNERLCWQQKQYHILYSSQLEIKNYFGLFCISFLSCTTLTFSWQRSLSCRNQSINLQSNLQINTMDWFLYDRDLCHKRVKTDPQIF